MIRSGDIKETWRLSERLVFITRLQPWTWTKNHKAEKGVSRRLVNEVLIFVEITEGS